MTLVMSLLIEDCLIAMIDWVTALSVSVSLPNLWSSIFFLNLSLAQAKNCSQHYYSGWYGTYHIILMPYALQYSYTFWPYAQYNCPRQDQRYNLLAIVVPLRWRVKNHQLWLTSLLLSNLLNLYPKIVQLRLHSKLHYVA